jgi:hypothetical protein
LVRKVEETDKNWQIQFEINSMPLKLEKFKPEIEEFYNSFLDFEQGCGKQMKEKENQNSICFISSFR